MIAAPMLAAYLSSCALSVAPDTMQAIVSVESRGNEFAINDNTLHRSFVEHDRPSAERTARLLLARGDNIDAGLAQVNSSNFSAYHVTVNQIFEPCTNLRIGSSILANSYTWALERFPDKREALWHAIMAYNSGSLFAGESYVRAVVGAALSPPLVPTISLLTAAPPSSAQPNDRHGSGDVRSASPSPALNVPLNSAASVGATRTLDVQIHHDI